MIDTRYSLLGNLLRRFKQGWTLRNCVFVFSVLAMIVVCELFVADAFAQEKTPTDEILPDQAHVMADVSYHFANLWFAATNKNWPLANYYLDKTRSHLAWAVRIRPSYTTKAGNQVDLNGILEAVTNTFLPAINDSINKKDLDGFKTAYTQTMLGCYGCHTACEKPFLKLHIPEDPATVLMTFEPSEESGAANAQTDDAGRGKAFFQQNCALCHATGSGPRNIAIGGQGPSLAGVFGRRAGTGQNFHYTQALTDSGLTWGAETLDHFLSNPTAAVHGTTMLVSVPDEQNRRHLIAYLKSLPAAAQSAEAAPASAPAPETDPGDWHHASPGLAHRVNLAELPAPYSTSSAGNGPKVVPRPADATLSVPPGFTVKQFAGGLSHPRLIRVAPNGDIFIAETGEDRIRVMRAADGAESPAENQVFADDLERPFGIAFYPPGNDPQWIYVANNNSVVRYPYRNGDLKAREAAQTIVPKIARTTGGHTTRDVAFSQDGKRMFISIGSGSNAGEEMGKKSPDQVALWQSQEKQHGFGEAWGAESNRANVLFTDPEGHTPLFPFATGIRNPVTMVINDQTGQLWVAVNERDGLGDDLVPDYISHIEEGHFYGWPWYYMGNHEDPRHAGERPDLANRVTVPDVPLQAHSASLEMTFYTRTEGVSVFPEEYRGDIFAALHGSWNRNNRTGYKVVRVRCKNGVATGEYDDFLTGFVVDKENVWGRPVGVAVAHDGALLVTEDGNSTLLRISYQPH
ncbi:MAG TPA: PQQ-dependent sugar dehydrogenase [Verrucomicrobiae bacterium]